MRGRFDPRRGRAEAPASRRADEADEVRAEGVELKDVVEALHFDLAEWLGTDALPKVFDRISGALDEQFTSVVTTGQAVDRETFLAGIWSARNVLAGVEIEVSEIAEIARSGQLVVVRFVAENRLGEVKTGKRTVTAVLVTDGRIHLWRTVHETPVPEPAQPAAPGPAEESAIDPGGEVAAVAADEPEAADADQVESGTPVG